MAFLVFGREDEEIKLRAFPLVLREEAKVWFQDLDMDKQGNWEALKRAFLLRYSGDNNPEEIWRKLSKLQQESPDSYSEYETQFLKLWTQWENSLPEGERAPNFLQKERFLAGLTPILQEKVKCKFPKSFKEALTWARLKDRKLQFQRSWRDHSQAARRVTTLEQVHPSSPNGSGGPHLDRLQRVTKQLDSLSINLIHGLQPKQPVQQQAGGQGTNDKAPRRPPRREYQCHDYGEDEHGMVKNVLNMHLKKAWNWAANLKFTWIAALSGPPNVAADIRNVGLGKGFSSSTITDGESETSQSTTFGSCPLAPEEEVGNVEVQFDPEEERLEVSKETFDAGLILASLGDAAIGCKQESQNKEETLPLNCAPSFAMAKDSHYILLTDIMHELNFTSGWQLLKHTFNEAKSGESNLPTDEQFKLTTKQLGLENMGRPMAPIAQAMNSHSIHLSGRSMLQMDENQMIIICHKEYSEDNAKFSLFAMKVITRLRGGHPLSLNAERVILIEKQFALRVFGIGYGCQALRAPYFMSYIAQALATGVEDPESLDPYKKPAVFVGEKMPDAVGMLPSSEKRIRLQSLHIEEVQSEEEGGASKRRKTTGSGPSSCKG
ncbi:hypothetical protein L7F22_062128 [Adiantum nelumboides]|nr:hypothetical protein [Adiantum nelumboides]